MSVQSRVLYTSPNGDRWSLARDPQTAHIFVRHEANQASGGTATDMGLAEFLAQGGMGPEKQELLRLIGTLVG